MSYSPFKYFTQHRHCVLAGDKQQANSKSKKTFKI